MIVALCGSRETEETSAITGEIVSAGGVIMGATTEVTVLEVVGVETLAVVLSVLTVGVELTGVDGIGVVMTSTGAVGGVTTTGAGSGVGAGALGATTGAGAVVPPVSTPPASCAKAGLTIENESTTAATARVIVCERIRCEIINNYPTLYADVPSIFINPQKYGESEIVDFG